MYVKCDGHDAFNKDLKTCFLSDVAQLYNAVNFVWFTVSKKFLKCRILCYYFSTYFVEYSFPVVATSRDKYQPNAMATEVIRVASKKIADRGLYVWKDVAQHSALLARSRQCSPY